MYTSIWQINENDRYLEYVLFVLSFCDLFKYQVVKKLILASFDDKTPAKQRLFFYLPQNFLQNFHSATNVSFIPI